MKRHRSTPARNIRRVVQVAAAARHDALAAGLPGRDAQRAGHVAAHLIRCGASAGVAIRKSVDLCRWFMVQHDINGEAIA